MLIGGLAAWRIHTDNEPEQYTPGERSADITSAVSDRAYVLAVGEIAMSGEASALADRDALLASYLSRGTESATA